MTTMLVDKIANALRAMNWNDQVAYSARAEQVCKAIGPAPEAADEMLLALKAALAPLNAYRGYGWGDRGGVIEAIKSAIAKAEG